jgi:hypothetical protein
MRARLLPAAVTILIALSGCSDPGDEQQRQQAAGGQVATPPSPEPSPKQPEFVGRRSPLIQELWEPVSDMTPLRTALPESLRFDEIQQAPLLHEAPIRSAVLAVGTEPQAYSVGEVAVMSPSGDWRVVDRGSLGMRNPDIVEQQFELSPDGRRLALGDEFGVVIIDLAKGTTTRIEIPSKDPVLHWWTPDGTSIVLTPRGVPKRTLALRVAGQVVEPLGYHSWTSSPGPADEVAEFVPNARSAEGDLLATDDAYTAIQHWRDDRETSDVVELENAVPRGSRPGRQWSSLIGVVQGAYPEGRTYARGVLAIDAATGQSRGLLRLAPAQIIWASVIGALEDRWLVLQIPFGPGGGLAAWDPVSAEVRGVLPIDEQAADVSIAMQLVSDSLR